MDYEYHFMGMNMVWWIVWVVLIFGIFFFPLSRGRVEKETPLDILQKKYASGKMTTEEYEERNIAKR
ncbi:MAG: SHOCT domain-containing protein [Fulvivirga sp.]